MRPDNQEPVPNSTLFQLNEIYLNFAEAMNEAYGPDDKHGYKYSAREAINIIRERSGQPAILSGSGIYSDFRELVRNERAIELAFDNHRFWDVRRWMIAEQEGVMSGAMYGIKIYWINSSPQEFRYTPYLYENRYLPDSYKTIIKSRIIGTISRDRTLVPPVHAIPVGTRFGLIASSGENVLVPIGINIRVCRSIP